MKWNNLVGEAPIVSGRQEVVSIYLITNKRNNKVYVGQTWETVERRLQRHIGDARNNRKEGGAKILDNAIRKYGHKNFSVVKLDEAYTQVQANTLEDFYILAASATGKGYNIKRGGSNGKHSEETKKKIGDLKRGIPRRKEDMAKAAETKIREGTHKGEKHGMAILNEDKVRKIRELVAEGTLSKSEVGRMYGVSPSVIYMIHTGQNWPHVGGPITPAKLKCGGTNNPKLTEEDVLEIRKKYAEGVPEFQLAKDYDISSTSIGNVVKKKTWTHI